MVSPEIQSRRETYTELMRELALKPRAELVRSVAETQEQLLAILAPVSEEQARSSPGEGEWCLRDLTMHAAFTERLVSKLIEYNARGEMPPAEDLAGAGIGMMPADEGKSFADVVAGLRAMNAGLLRTIEAVPEEPNLERILPHPFFGPLNCLEWAGFQRVHDLDHMQHAQRIIAQTTR
jgi:hypothetical protein